MRHRHGYKRLGTGASHNKALLKNLVVALIKNERIMTTLPKAKELRRTGDKMIGLAKKNTENSKKKAWTWLRHPDTMEKLFGPLRQRYLARPGGYTRVLRAPPRLGDRAPMAVIEFVDNRFPPLRPDRASLKKQKISLSQKPSADVDILKGTETLPGTFEKLNLNGNRLTESSLNLDSLHKLSHKENPHEPKRDTGTLV